MDAGTARACAADGWRALRAFFSEGARHLPDAIAAFEEAERLLRSARGVPGAPAAAPADLDGVLIGLSIALGLRRRPEDVRRAVVLAQELLNIVRRRTGDEAAVPLRAYLEDAYRDLANVEGGAAAARAAEDGVEACDRTLSLARRLDDGGAAAHARAVKALLLRRLAALEQGGADAAALRRESDRLAAAALSGWPGRDAEGLAGFQADLAAALAEEAVASGPPGRSPRRPAPLDRAERLVRQAERAAPPENRYLAARIARSRARVALAADRTDALDAVAAAADAFRALGLTRDAEEVEGWV